MLRKTVLWVSDGRAREDAVVDMVFRLRSLQQIRLEGRRRVLGLGSVFKKQRETTLGDNLKDIYRGERVRNIPLGFQYKCPSD